MVAFEQGTQLFCTGFFMVFNRPHVVRNLHG